MSICLILGTSLVPVQVIDEAEESLNDSTNLYPDPYSFKENVKFKNHEILKSQKEN